MLQLSEHLIVQLIPLRISLALKRPILNDFLESPGLLHSVPLLACLLNQAVNHFLETLPSYFADSYLEHNPLVLFAAPDHRDNFVAKHSHAIGVHAFQTGKDHQQLLVLSEINPLRNLTDPF